MILDSSNSISKEINGDIVSLKVFISSNQKEFYEERKLIKQELENDFKFKDYVDVFVFEENEAKSISPRQNFINALNESDVYIGILGSVYGDIKENGISSTEYEYDIFNSISNKGNNTFFFIKDLNEREDRTNEFIEKIKSNTSFKIFNNTVELICEIKKSLKQYINYNLTSEEFDFKKIFNSSWEDINKDALNLLFNSITYKPICNLIGQRSDENILILLGLGNRDLNGKFYLNNAGALFLAKDVNKFRLEHEVKMVRFKGNNRLHIMDKCFTSEAIPILLNQFERFFYKNIKIGSTIAGLRRVEIPEYPFNAVREGMVNALAHRDYEFKGSFIQFYIFDNRIEIISPGNLLHPLRVSNLKDIQYPIHRNKNISSVFSKTLFMEHVGSGIKRMCDEMKRACLPEPEFTNGNGYFKVTFWGPNGELIYPENVKNQNSLDLSELNLNFRQINALTKMVNEKEEYSYEKYSNNFGISKSTAKRDLSDLVEKGLVNIKVHKRRNYYSCE